MPHMRGSGASSQLLAHRALVFTPIFLLLIALALPSTTAAQPDERLERARQLNAAIVEHYRQGRYAEAVPIAREALALREAALGPDHPQVAQSLNNLAQQLL